MPLRSLDPRGRYLPDVIPAHPCAVAMASALLAPKAQVSLYPWKDPKDRIPLVVATSAASCRRIASCRVPTRAGLSARQVPPVRCRPMVYDTNDASVHVCTHSGRQLEQALLTLARPHRRLVSNPRRLQ
jgi:hypothetical protein